MVWSNLRQDYWALFFKDANENAVTVTAERYRNMLGNFIQPQLTNMPEYWWQQDGATAHTPRAIIFCN